ncbi:splicing factor 3B subunit 1, partial [Tanacetum coccineum]
MCDNEILKWSHKMSSSVAVYFILWGLNRPPTLGFRDDIVLTASSESLLQHIIISLHQEFAMTELGPLNYFLGISVTRDSSRLFLSQKKYAVEILDRAHMVNCNPSRTPIDTESKLGSDGDIVSDPTLYRSLADYGLQLFSSSTTDLVAYSDADWAGCSTTRRSTLGYCVFLGNNLLSWSSKRHPTLSRSSAEAEYRVVALLRLVGCAIYCRTKHIKIDIHCIRDLVAAGQPATLEDQEDRVLYKLDELVRPYVLHKILVVIEPLLIDEDYYACVEGREIISNLSKAAGLATMIAAIRLDIDNIDEYVRNTTARAFSVVASALGILPLLPFLKAVCQSKKSWQARHTGIKMVQQIAILVGCAVLPHMRSLVEIIEHGLNDENQKVRTITALSLAALAEAAALAILIGRVSGLTVESTEGVEADYICTDILPEFFRNFWVRRMALDRRNYKQLVETTVEIANKVGVPDIVARVVEDLKDESEPYRRMVMETIEKGVA